jgi:quercetin dioxygenase-like cupin family protein
MSEDPFNLYEPSRRVEMVPGVYRQMLACGNGAMVVRIDCAKGSEVPIHTHPHEQIGHLVSGRATLKVGDKAVELKPNDGYAIPSNVPHGVVDCPEDSVFVDVFSPPREEYRQ